jgi:UDP-N-acetylmuramoylalanine--D-glutamate ligase
MGLGRFGGGEAAVRFLAERGARVLATDLKPETHLAAVVSRLQDLPRVEFRLGRHEERDFLDADVIVVNPAVSLESRLLASAVGQGAMLTSEINLFWLHCRAPIIGVTGTNGKSTAATLIHDMLRTSGLKSRLGGNIGRSLLDEVDDIAADERIVLELSSFQLEMLDQIRRSPHVAVVTNFTPNHLDRHGTLDRYRQAKQTLLRFQSADDVAILNADDPDSSRWPTRARRLRFGRDRGVEGRIDESGVSINLPGRTRRIVPENPALQGPHNLANLAAATLAAAVTGADLAAADQAVRNFHGLPHRQEIVAETNGRRFINDSKATTPEAAAAALDALRPSSGRLILLAGGADKGVDLQPFAQRIAQSVSAVALMGATARPLAELLNRISGPDGPRRFCAPTFASAFDWAVRQSESGDTVLLSPGCASYGWFEDFEARGTRFVELVDTWTGANPIV